MNIQEKIVKILDNHILMRLATVNEEGYPRVRSVDFARDLQNESKLYFMTFKNSAKVNELNNNNHVHIVIDKDASNIEELSHVLYLKASGIANEVVSQEEIHKGMGLIMQKYPYLSNLPGDPSMMTLFRIELKNVVVTDNSVTFGHTEEYNY